MIHHSFVYTFLGINVEYFPFDEQKCSMKFSSWTYDGLQVSARFYIIVFYNFDSNLYVYMTKIWRMAYPIFLVGESVEPSWRGRSVQLRTQWYIKFKRNLFLYRAMNHWDTTIIIIFLFFKRVVANRWVGSHWFSGGEKRGVLFVLRRTLSGYHVSHCSTSQASLLR